MIVVGLGNPGRRYALTRHNVGFMVVDALAIRAGAQFVVESRYALTEAVLPGCGPLILFKPLTFMNESGEALRDFSQKRAVSPGELLVVHDDMDLPFGRIRVRRKGKSAGHHGVESVQRFLGTIEFGRVRVGIGRPPEGTDPVDYVLSPFSEPEEQVSMVIKRAADAVQSILSQGYEAAMSTFNGL
ncbi:MAG TPA: aminoacyl-tRNA hydrolase [Firmicutes bacterium]|nr:aminoacyl-tRNA hydrolase [Bacillota bacterium]